MFNIENKIILGINSNIGSVKYQSQIPITNTTLHISMDNTRCFHCIKIKVKSLFKFNRQRLVTFIKRKDL